MRITYLCLKNFASVFTGMKKRKVEIDLSKSKNRVILLVGGNGSGKTSILSNLHPFATPGNMDVRNSDDPILKGEDGYKEIHLINGDNKYIIKHHYIQSKTGRNIKSFFSKNGVELNPNGLVTSFKELVELELGLELNYLKLLRLGSNVTGFIDEKASERKNFSSELLSDIDIYTQFYKKINDDSKFLKATLKSISDKIEKLKILDENDIKTKISNLENKLNELINKKDELQSIKWKLVGSINTIIPEGIDSFLSLLEEDERKYKYLVKEIKMLEDKLNKMDIIIIGSIDKEIKRLEKQIADAEGTLSNNKNMIEFYFRQLESYYKQRDDKTNNLKYLASEYEYSKLNDMYLELHRRKEGLDKTYKDYVPKCSKEDLLSALGVVQEIDKIISRVNDFGHNEVTNVINLFMDNRNVDVYVKNELKKIDVLINKKKIELVKNTKGENVSNLYVIFKPPRCQHDTCPYIEFYNEINCTDNMTGTNIEKEIKNLEDKYERISSMSEISKNIDYILLLINSNKDLIKRLPVDIFNIKNILSSIKSGKPFYDEEYITNLISIIEEYEEYISIKDKIKELKKEIYFIEKNMSSLELLQKELETVNIEIYNIESNIKKMKDENKQIEENLQELGFLKELYIIHKDTEDIIEEKQNILKELEISIISRQDIKLKASESIDKVRELDKEISTYDIEIKNIQNEINDNQFKLKDFISLNDEKKLLEDKFDDINILKEALSTNKGIPLLFIQLYFKNTKLIVNNLLDTIYKGDLEIDDFEITDKEFKIPYIKNGIRVNDVVMSSQGERSFISIALSFALIIQSLKNYNIMLLDEIDATLDQNNRYLFLSILEKQIESIGAEQVFLITHNNMFDNYPVDLILTSDVEIDNFKSMNVIYKAR